MGNREERYSNQKNDFFEYNYQKTGNFEGNIENLEKKKSSNR